MTYEQLANYKINELKLLIVSNKYREAVGNACFCDLYWKKITKKCSKNLFIVFDDGIEDIIGIVCVNHINHLIDLQNDLKVCEQK